MTRWFLVALALVATPVVAQPAPKAAASKATAVVNAPLWTVNRAASSIGFSGSVDGAAFRGSFTRWNAGVRFDPANLAGSSARVIVEPASVSSGDSTRDTTLREADWFDTARSPQVIFQTNTIRSTGPGAYEAVGTLSVKGRAIPFTLPFTLTINGANAEMRASVSVDRTRLGLGVQFDPSGGQVAKTVAINVVVRATRTP